MPAGYGFDYIDADGLIHELRVVDGRITTRSGMSYRVLGLDPYSKHMSLPVLRAIHKLVEDGAVVAGPKPADDPSLADDQREFSKLNDELFGDGTGVHSVGKGTVYAGQGLTDVFNALKVAPDFEYTKPESDARLLFVHRILADGDLYFVDNRTDREETVDATFRVTGKAPELWHPETGQSEPVSYNLADGRTTVPLRLEPWGTVFVVFRKATQETSLFLPKVVETRLTGVEGSWNVSFQPGRGAPASITLDKLMSWSDSTDAGVKYFSGTGAYTKTIQAPAHWFKKGMHLWIDLGDVKNLAEVTLNGHPLGVLWKHPFVIDVTDAGLLKNACPDPNRACVQSHGGFVSDGSSIFFTTGSSLMIETDESGRLIKMMDTGIENEHLMEVATDGYGLQLLIPGSRENLAAPGEAADQISAKLSG